MTSLPLNIAIIGAGPGGLTLARLLQRNNISFRIFDREASPAVRGQGGTLDLHPESGQLALRAAGLYEEFIQRARFEGDCLKLVMPNGTVVLDETAHQADECQENKRPEGDRPEIDRLQLRDMLLCSLKPRAVQWAHKLLKVEPYANGSIATRETYRLHFIVSEEHYEEGPFDVVIGADGARSNVRPLLTNQQPFYSGVSLVELHALDVDEKKEWLANYVGAGSCFMFDKGRAVLAQRNGNGCIRVYACVMQPEWWFDTCGIDWSTPNAARKKLVDEYYSDCAGEIKRIILDADDGLMIRRLDMLPVGLSWAPRGGVTLIGDAAHLMLPFAGEGVNAALHDALELGQAIIHGVGKNQGADGVIEELVAYERGMFKRTSSLAQQTWDQVEICFSRDGAERLVEIVTARPPMEDEEDPKDRDFGTGFISVGKC